MEGNKIILIDDRFRDSPGVVVKDAETVEILPCGCVLFHDESRRDFRCKTARELRESLWEEITKFVGDRHSPTQDMVLAHDAYYRHFEEQREAQYA